MSLRVMGETYWGTAFAASLAIHGTLFWLIGMMPGSPGSAIPDETQITIESLAVASTPSVSSAARRAPAAKELSAELSSLQEQRVALASVSQSPEQAIPSHQAMTVEPSKKQDTPALSESPLSNEAMRTAPRLERPRSAADKPAERNTLAATAPQAQPAPTSENVALLQPAIEAMPLSSAETVAMAARSAEEAQPLAALSSSGLPAPLGHDASLLAPIETAVSLSPSVTAIPVPVMPPDPGLADAGIIQPSKTQGAAELSPTRPAMAAALPESAAVRAPQAENIVVLPQAGSPRQASPIAAPQYIEPSASLSRPPDRPPAMQSPGRTEAIAASTLPIAPADRPAAHAQQTASPLLQPDRTPARAEPLNPAERLVPSSPQTAGLLRPDEPERPQMTPRQSLAVAYRLALPFLRRHGRGECFVALPLVAAEGYLVFRSFADEKARQMRFAELLATSEIAALHDAVSPVSEAQCATLAFAAGLQRFPDFSLKIELANNEIASGELLEGRIRAVEAPYFSLLVVDDEGLVQDMEPFLSRSGMDAPSFSAPMVLTGTPVTDTQLLVAIASDRPLLSILAGIGRPAEDYFEQLREEIERAGAEIDIAIAPFTVRRTKQVEGVSSRRSPDR
jgi:hypothetical protein